MKKTYGMRNTKECVLKLQRGKATIVCPFTKGNLQSREPVPASFTTSNTIIQGVLEESPMFMGGKIFVMATYSDAEVAEAEPVKTETKKTPGKRAAKAEPKEARVMEHVKTFGDAVTVLMTESDVAASDLTDIANVIRKAAEIGISFPNLKQ